MLMMQQMFGSNTSNMNPMAAMMRQVMSQNQGQLPSINPQQFISIINNMSQDEFINEATIIHNGKYDYSKNKIY